MSFSVGANIAKIYYGWDFEIKNLLWPIVICLYIYKYVTGYKTQHYNDLKSLLSDNKYATKIIKLLEGQRDFHTLAVVAIHAEYDPQILWISDSALLLTNEFSHQKALASLKNSQLASKVKASCKSVPADFGTKLFKFNFKLSRQD